MKSMRFSNAFFRALALVGVALLLCSVPAQRDFLGQPDRGGHSSSCVYRQCPYSDKGVCFAMDAEPGTDACGARGSSPASGWRPR